MKSTIQKIKDLEKNGDLIYKIGSDLPVHDFNFEHEAFYVAKTGKYFVIGTGGAGSAYRTGNGATAKGAQKVIPCSKEYFSSRIKADKEGWTWSGEGYFRYTDEGDIEHLNMKTGETYI